VFLTLPHHVRAKHGCVGLQRYIRSDADDQINLPSRMTTALEDIEREGDSVFVNRQEAELIWKEAKNEIYELMRRNFYHNFVLMTTQKVSGLVGHWVVRESSSVCEIIK
jgi:hypothetical protein